jgi:hypothetical protein
MSPCGPDPIDGSLPGMTSIRTSTEGAPQMSSKTARLPLLVCALAAAFATTAATASADSGANRVAFGGRLICVMTGAHVSPGCAPPPSPLSVQ